MKRLLTLVLLLAAQAAGTQQAARAQQAPTTPQIDPSLVGMWQLQWLGPQILWQVRADGTYRLMGVGARPNEHWGRMQAAGGRWASEWERGKDSGGYSIQGNNWTVAGALGTGTWIRIWPSAQAVSNASCPYIDVAAVERQFASAVTSRMIQNDCEFSATKVGITDGLVVSSEIVDPNQDGLRLKRADCASGTNKDPGVRCLQGVGETAFFRYGRLYAYQGNRQISIGLGTFPKNDAVNDTDSIALAKIVLARP
jgi:hypothetical protein